MSLVEGDITINVAPEATLQALEDVALAPEWVPSLDKVWAIQGRGAGCTYRWQYRVGKLKFTGSTEIIESAPERFVMRTQGGIPSVWTWTIIDTKNSVILDLQIDYMLPSTLLGNIAASILKRQGRREARLALRNLKNRLEK